MVRYVGVWDNMYIYTYTHTYQNAKPKRGGVLDSVT